MRNLIPPQLPGENLFRYILRSSQELRDSREQRLAEQVARIEQRARVSGHQTQANQGKTETPAG
jgi:hypothetical protein